MTKYKGMVSDILTAILCGGAELDFCDMMRVNMFAMDAESVSDSIDSELPKELYINEFMNRIVETHGFRGFNNFCRIDKGGLMDIGETVYNAVSM